MQRWMHVRRSLEFLSRRRDRRPIVPPPFLSNVFYFSPLSPSLPSWLHEEKISIPFNWIIAGAEVRFRETRLFSS